ncbi:MAG: sulfur oxidation c-type cytochrome SoxX [Alphaproteobacteria bacterium]|nr:sulfur oxidation c-type cytochrome SoxX [Alphaproteobacteria bacterium]
MAVAAERLVPIRIVGNREIPASLTGKSGDAARGRAVAVDRALGNCLACHVLPVDEKLQGDVGPDLRGVGVRLTEGELRLRVVNPKIVNAQTAMPAYYRVDGLFRVRKDLQGRPILGAAQIEDVVAYLKTLKD